MTKSISFEVKPDGNFTVDAEGYEGACKGKIEDVISHLDSLSEQEGEIEVRDEFYQTDQEVQLHNQG